MDSTRLRKIDVVADWLAGAMSESGRSFIYEVESGRPDPYLHSDNSPFDQHQAQNLLPAWSPRDS